MLNLKKISGLNITFANMEMVYIPYDDFEYINITYSKLKMYSKSCYTSVKNIKEIKFFVKESAKKNKITIFNIDTKKPIFERLLKRDILDIDIIYSDVTQETFSPVWDMEDMFTNSLETINECRNGIEIHIISN